MTAPSWRDEAAAAVHEVERMMRDYPRPVVPIRYAQAPYASRVEPLRCKRDWGRAAYVTAVVLFIGFAWGAVLRWAL